VLALEPGVGRRARRGRPHRRRQAGEVALALEHQAPGLLVLQDVLAELRGERRQPLVDLGDARFRLAAESGAGADEPGVVQLQHTQLLVGEAQAIAALVEIMHARKDLRVEHHRSLVRGELRRDLALHGLQGVAGMRAGEIEEHRAHAVQRAA